MRLLQLSGFFGLAFNGIEELTGARSVDYGSDAFLRIR